jgi:nicotinic acid mononucleotide adenylyltransferase
MSKVEGKMIQTYDLLNRLKLKHDNVTFYFVLGGDNVVNLKTWGHA